MHVVDLLPACVTSAACMAVGFCMQGAQAQCVRSPLAAAKGKEEGGRAVKQLLALRCAVYH